MASGYRSFYVQLTSVFTHQQISWHGLWLQVTYIQCCRSGSGARIVRFSASRIRMVIILSGSGSFQQQTNKVRKTLISAILWLLFDFLSTKTDDMHMHLQKGISKKTVFKNLFFVGILSRKKQDPDPRIRFERFLIVPKCHGSTALLFIVLLFINNSPWPVSSFVHDKT